MPESTVEPAASCRLRTDAFGWSTRTERGRWTSMKNEEKKKKRFERATEKEVSRRQGHHGIKVGITNK